MDKSSVQAVEDEEEKHPKLEENKTEEVDDQIKELNITFGTELADFPHVTEFIDRLKTIIRRQQKKLNKFYSKLKDHRLRPVVTSADAAVQTENESKSPEIVTPLTPNDGPSNAWGEGGDLAEEVKQVAEQAAIRTGMVYEPTSGMYYDYHSGYYYNAERRMYYDGHSGRYLVYDEETKKYTFLGESSAATGTPSKDKSDEDKKSKRRRVEGDGEEVEDGEVSDSSSGDENPASPSQEVAAAWPPCLRLMVTSSSAPGVGVGRLFLVTCQGGEVGREGNPPVLLPEPSVSKVHLRISFVGETYQVVDVGSRNGTWLNNKRLAAALQESEPTDITHGDELRIGSTTLSVHVHPGQDTCGGCEPGLQQPNSQVAAPLPAAVPHRTALRSLKKRFGVSKSATVPAPDGSYTDRAERRRTAVGSSHPAEKTETACLTQSIPSENKGFKMLAKMGWSAGQSLGKNEQGISVPVPLVSNVGATGLGATPAPEVALARTNAAKRKLRMLKMTHTRYNQPPKLPQNDSGEE